MCGARCTRVSLRCAKSLASKRLPFILVAGGSGPGVDGHLAALKIPLAGESFMEHDQETERRQIPALFPQEESEDGQTKESRHVQHEGRREETRTRHSIFQAELVAGSIAAAFYITEDNRETVTAA